MPSATPVIAGVQWTLVQQGPFSGRLTNLRGGVVFARVATSTPADDAGAVQVVASIDVFLAPGENLYARSYSNPVPVQVDPELVMVAHPPLVLMTNRGGDYARLRVDPDQTSFWEGKQYRTFYELNVPAGQSRVFKAVVGVNTVLFDVSLVLDSGSVRLRTVAGGTEGGSFSEALPIIRKNTMTDCPVVSSSNVLTTGGTLNLSGAIDIDRIRLVAANATAQQSSVGSKNFDQRGVAPGTYYWNLENFGSGAATGVFSGFWEER